jgi:proline racemase
VDHVESLEAAERAAIEVLSQQLAEHLALAGDTFNFLNRVLGGAPEMPVREVSHARKVATALFLRLTNDLRCVAFLAPRGYPLQAVSLVAPMYEGAYTMVVVGGG